MTQEEWHRLEGYFWVYYGGREGRTVYVADPPWKNQRDSIKAVRGYLMVHGLIEYR